MELNEACIKKNVLEIIKAIHPNWVENDENLFNTKNNFPPFTVVYIINKIEEVFNIKIDDKFIADIQNTNVSSLSKAILNLI
jgi:acyl carrier protein